MQGEIARARPRRESVVDVSRIVTKASSGTFVSAAGAARIPPRRYYTRLALAALAQADAFNCAISGFVFPSAAI